MKNEINKKELTSQGEMEYLKEKIRKRTIEIEGRIMQNDQEQIRKENRKRQVERNEER